MRIVVTGASGFVGAQVVRKLGASGHDVHAVVRSMGSRARLEGIDGIQWVEADLATEAGRERIAAVKPEACIHAAWYTEPGKYLTSLCNIDLQAATLALARKLAEGGCRRFLGLGTCIEYDTTFGLLSEETPLRPGTLYAAAKAGTFLALRELGAVVGMQVVWARLFHLYGPGEQAGRLVPSVSQQLLAGNEACTTPGAQLRDFIHVEDAASAICALIHSDVVGAVNVGSGRPVTVESLVRRLGDLAGRPDLVRIGAIPYSPNEPMFICADTRKLVAATGWAPRWSLEDGLAQTLNWWRSGDGGVRTPSAATPRISTNGTSAPHAHTPRSTCPLCDGTELTVFVEREKVPVHQNMPFRDAASAQNTTRGDLRLAACRSCGFVTNLAFREELLRYGEGYENDQTLSPTFDMHTESRIASLVESGIRDRLVVDVGCGQGQFLRRLCAVGPNRGIGFDPAYVGPDRVDDGRVSFVRAFYGGSPSAAAPDLVVCRHVIEHVVAPLAFLKNIQAALRPEHPTRLAFETPTVDWILEGGVVQDFFYEHCSYFTADSLRFAFERAGFTNVETMATFGGQYLWGTAEYRPEKARAPRMAPNAITKSVERYLRQEQASRALLESKIARLGASGRVAVWGAGAKGVTVLNLIDPRCQLVDCAVDVNPKKQGKFIAGTGHPIVSPAELRARGIRGILVMNPNYLDEIKKTVHASGADAVVTE
jgi:nucleoside-diphosphate-sugar epimerase/2-polyprenyl-3-methyl-5-hydroxy-6-metoxy-1,4-benzoquinol methylase